MIKEMVIACSPHETKVALVEDGRVVEVYVEREKEFGLVGSIYKGRVTRVLPGMQSAFVDIGLDRDAFLYVSDFYEDLEEYEREAVAEVEESEAQGQVRPPVAERTPEPISEKAEPPAPPAGEVESPAPPAAQPGLPEEERQPDHVHHDPPLALPETRPRGRGRRRHRRRGGRGRHRRGRHPHRGRERPEAEHRAEPPAESPEPIILPGESLAKYRDRTPSSGAEAERPAQDKPSSQPEPSPEPESPAGPQAQAETEQVSPAREAPAAPQAREEEKAEGEDKAVSSHPPEEPARREETSSSPPPQDDQTKSTSDETEASREEKDAAGREKENNSGQESQDSYPDTAALAELERTHRREDQFRLPPSVHDRVGGGVEWERQRREGHGRPRRGRRGRGRHGRRGRRGPRDRGRAFGQRMGGRPVPGRRMHARPSRGQPAIAQLLKPGQEIIIQIAKEQMGKKGARITSHVSLPGRFLVYMPTIEHVGVSRRIGTAEERARLRRILHELKGNISGGFVVRTAASGASEEDLHEDIDYLIKLWHDIRVRFEERPSPALLHRDLNLVQRVLRDNLTDEYQNVWIDSEEEYAKVVEFVGHFQPEFTNRVKLYTKETPIFEEMGVQREIDRALQAKVWLKSGGYIVVNHTEALVAIDVNTGKYVGKGSSRLEDTIVKTNLDAVQEIVRQIRLRDLGGIIIIDFIDMEDRRNRHRVMRALEDALRTDRSPSKVLAFNEFGLVAITRKRSRQSLERLLCQPCPYCTGSGMVKSLPTLCYEIQGEAHKMAGTIDAPELTIRANPEIVKVLKGREAYLVRELEEQTGKNIILQPDHTLHFEQYTIF